MRNQILKSSFFTLALVFLPGSCFAQYKWTDPSGIVFYGSRPPASARHVEKVQPKNYSRYSSSRSLKPYGSQLFRKPDARAALKQESKIKEEDLKTGEAPTRAEPLPALPEQTVRIESGKPEVKTSRDGEITNCRVTVTNRSLIDVEGVQVAFEFGDGTLITADGPARLNAQQAAIFTIPSENTPLVLAPGTKPEPKVLINSDADLESEQPEKK